MNPVAARALPATTAPSETGAVSRNSSSPLRDSSLIIRMVRSGGSSTDRIQKGHDPPSSMDSAVFTSPPVEFSRKNTKKKPL